MLDVLPRRGRGERGVRFSPGQGPELTRLLPSGQRVGGGGGCQADKPKGYEIIALRERVGGGGGYQADKLRIYNIIALRAIEKGSERR